MQETKTNKIKKTDPDNRYRRVLAASTLTGDSVRNSAGDDLGKVDEIMIDIPSGKVAYAVLSFGGVLRTLNVPKGTLKDAPGFDKDNWPDMANSTWGSEVFRHYGASPYWEDEYDEVKTRRGGSGV